MSFDFDAALQAPLSMQPGLRRLAPGALQLTPAVEPHRGVSRHLREKLAVFRAFRDQALLCQPGFDPGPALALLAAQAETEHPQAWRLQLGQWQAPGLGWTLDEALQPLAIGRDWPEVGSLLTETAPHWRRAVLLCLALTEDFSILDGSSGSLPWMAVALPSMWAPERVISRHFSELHAPAADTAAQLAAANQLIRLVTGPDRYERCDWTMAAHPRLHAHPQRVDPARWAPGLDDDQLVAQTWWRTERQTFISMPVRDDVGPQAVYTLKVAVTPLARAMQEPAQAARLHAVLASMSTVVLAYRDLSADQAGLLRWLARRAEGRQAAMP